METFNNLENLYRYYIGESNELKKMEWERITINEKPDISADILKTIMSNMGYSRQKAVSFVKRVIIGSIKGDVVFINDIPHRKKEIDNKYVKDQLSYFKIEERLIDEFFNRNFQYSEAVIPPGAEYRPAETIDQAAKRLAKNTVDFDLGGDLSWV